MKTYTQDGRTIMTFGRWGARRDLQTGNPRAPRSALMKEKSGIIGGLVLQRGAPCWTGDNRKITPPWIEGEGSIVASMPWCLP